MNPIAQANAVAAESLVDELARAGVRQACICPGSRSTPLVLALAAEARLRKWTVTDERSAGFFALGMARASGTPAVVVCTSGTAAANLVPAVTEAALAEVPLVVVTADRPTELRDCGAAQTIRQAGLFSSHARWSADAPVPDGSMPLEPYFRSLACRAVSAARESPAGPVHLNIPFREPLFDESVAAAGRRSATPGRDGGRPWCTVDAAVEMIDGAALGRLSGIVARARRGLIVCGPSTASAGFAAAVAELAAALGCPILADPLSGVRHGRHDRSCVVDAYDIFLRRGEVCRALRPDLILRFGALPTSKPLQRFMQSAETGHHVLVAAGGTWPDPLFVTSEVIRADAAMLCDALSSRLSSGGAHRPNLAWLDNWREISGAVRRVVDAELERDGEIFEGRLASEALRLVPDGALVFVGNGMPVRDMDTFGAGSDRNVAIFGNRGASGIDGVLSTALGAAAVRRRAAVLIVGDLSFLHDLGGLQIAARHEIDLVVVVVNNDGGGIFSFLPQAGLGERFETYFATPHGLDLGPAVRMCGGRFQRVATWSALRTALGDGLAAGGLHVVEVPVDRERNVGRHREIMEVALARLGAVPEAAA